MSLPSGERAVPLLEAASILGISADAVRKRLDRGTLRGIKRGRERFVLLADDADAGIRSRPSARPDDPSPADDAFATLREQLTVKDEQLRRQQDEIERLTVMLADTQTTIRGLLGTGAYTAPRARDDTSEQSDGPHDGSVRQRGAETAPRGFWERVGDWFKGNA